MAKIETKTKMEIPKPAALAAGHCVPCEGGLEPLKMKEALELLTGLESGWQVLPNSKKAGDYRLCRQLKFADFKSAMLFLNALAFVAENEGHHPDFTVHYNRVELTLWTHAIGGLHPNDFVLAAKIDRLLAK